LQNRKHLEGSVDLENLPGFGKSMSAIRFQRMLDIPGILLSDAPNEKACMLLFLWQIKRKTNGLLRLLILTEIQLLSSPGMNL
jgi:hypothetical protein